MSVFALALVFVAALPGDAAAQLRLSVAGGPSYPLGSLSDNFDTGWHAQASAGLAIPLVPIGLRVDAAINRFSRVDNDFQVISGSLNGVLSLPSVVLVPYVIGGVGAYSSSVDDATDIDEETTNIGANAGAGIRLGLPGVAVFLEARFHNIFADGGDVRFAPISVGINF